jgi:hypothetical protein
MQSGSTDAEIYAMGDGGPRSIVNATVTTTPIRRLLHLLAEKLICHRIHTH